MMPAVVVTFGLLLAVAGLLLVRASHAVRPPGRHTAPVPVHVDRRVVPRGPGRHAG